jgi:hypothetical protein
MVRFTQVERYPGRSPSLEGLLPKRIGTQCYTPRSGIPGLRIGRRVDLTEDKLPACQATSPFNPQ